MPAVDFNQRIGCAAEPMKLQYEDRTLFGSTNIRLAVEQTGLNYEAGPPVNEALQISWDSVTRASSAGENLVMAFRENGSGEKEIRIPLPVGLPRDAVVANVRSFVGPKWASAAPAPVRVAAPRRTGGIRQTVVVFALIGTTAVCMLMVLLAYSIVLALLVNEYMLCVYAFGGGAWIFRRGLLQYRNRLAVLSTPTARANSAAIGLAELSGRARGRHGSPAPITGTAAIYWKVQIRQWVKRSGGKGRWRTLMNRESVPLDTLELEDETGRIPIWCRRAEVILPTQRWSSRREAQIPAQAQAVLASLKEKWPGLSDRNEMVITETRLEQGGPLYVIGTLAESWRVQAAAASQPTGPSSRSGPRFPAARLRSLFAIPLFVWGSFTRQLSKELRRRPSSPPSLDPHSVLVWKGDQGRPFIISHHTERDTIECLYRRMWLWMLGGAGLMAGTLFFVLKWIFS